MAETILAVDDELTLRETLEYNLKRQGYSVVLASTGLEALRLAREIHPDLVILDLALPGMDGLEVCRTLRRESQVPILMLTARSEEIDRVLGLELGADDYLTKPFSLRELMARVKALLRRAGMNQPADLQPIERPLVFGNLTVDTSRHQVLLDGNILELSPREYDLMVFFAHHRGQVLSRDVILERVWGWDYDGGTRTIDVHIRWLRNKIEIDPSNPQRIVTIRGAGYRFDG